MKGMIGREVRYVDEFEIEKGMIRRFATCLGDLSPLYYDEEFARGTEYGGIIAPPTMIFEWNHHAHSLFPPDQRDSIFRPLPRQPRILRGINEYEIIEPLRPGDVIETRARVVDVYQKQGHSGPLVFVIAEIDYFNQKQERLAKSRDTMVMLA